MGAALDTATRLTTPLQSCRRRQCCLFGQWRFWWSPGRTPCLSPRSSSCRTVGRGQTEPERKATTSHPHSPQPWATARARYPHLGIGRLGGELVTPLTVLVVQQHHTLRGAHSEAAAVGRPGHAGHTRGAVLRDTHSFSANTARILPGSPRPETTRNDPTRPAGPAGSARAAAA